MTETVAPPFPTLQTERLHLREITHADVNEMFAMHGDVELMKWFGEPVADLDGAGKLIDMLAGWRLLPDPGARWGLERKDAPGLIGTCGLFGWIRRDRKCTVGYELGTAFQGQGYMFEALTALMEWGWDNMDLVRIEARIHPDNLASQRLAARAGFELEGRLRKVAFWSGVHHDLNVYSALRLTEPVAL